ncbi:DUF7332 family protein [Natrinema versiforme]|uniref:Uncharacterized protein n=1 Tax=Natrinema versiforme JCM 10478 TaxID=1227496 RepID=L9Y861_9EURY|nr:hypothetical protein [Natrinema versiforme]ELY70234.1 hypothetical protein C489_02771 [Natrinema versiforme JCM 10478]
MQFPRRPSTVSVLVLCCLVFLATVPAATVAQQSPAPVGNGADSSGQSISTCFTGSGTELTIGSENGTHIWVRFHAAMLTDSGGSVGAELVGSTGGSSIVEVIAGFQYVGDGLRDLLTSPADSIDLVSGFDFQLPMLENATTGLGAEPSQSDEDQSDGEGTGTRSDGAATESDGRFELLRC